MATISTTTIDLLVSRCVDELARPDEVDSTIYIDRNTGDINELFNDPDDAAFTMGSAAKEMHYDTKIQLEQQPESLVEFENPITESLVNEIEDQSKRNGHVLSNSESSSLRRRVLALFYHNETAFYAAVKQRLRTYGLELA